jgi:hypothetical protein
LELILRGNKQTLEKGEKGVLYLKGEKGVLYLPKKERSSRAGARVQPKHIMTTKMTNERKIENTITITRALISSKSRKSSSSRRSKSS